ncbi:hypothetical protein AJ80_08920 [Polytolypa hystricis UAMH7299]|uniref:FAD-binding domain-containing protein n=1 Tax=Polytolypa hystricis (strain UAMH7299) TaxID=1447883 RepID=A0A2B7WYY6_POLH7|nr:hypothetical protein AJ80_08920 [Polytolypa hystricis UAMH7299]
MGSVDQKQFSVAIIGAGLAGLSLAIGLHRRGVTSHVYDAAPKFLDIGAGLSFAVNSLKALEAVDQECYELFKKRCEGMSLKKDVYMTFRDGMGDGEPVTTLYCKGSGQQAVHRTLLVKDMTKLMPENTLHMGKKLRDITKTPAGGYILDFEDDTTEEFDVVLGADGIKSRVRQILLGEDNPDSYPKFSGEFAYRDLVPMETACEVLGEEFARNGNVNMGLGGLTTSYPVEGGSMLNLVAARDAETWDHAEWVIPSDVAKIQEEFKGYGSKIQQLISLFKDPKAFALFHHPHTSTFYSGRLAIIGDAAHAATPHQGAGCGQAFEDALILCELLSDESVRAPEDVQRALAAYDAIRRPHTLRVVETSRENGAICMMKGPTTGEDWGKIKANLDKRFEWMWRVPPVADVPILHSSSTKLSLLTLVIGTTI